MQERCLLQQGVSKTGLAGPQSCLQSPLWSKVKQESWLFLWQCSCIRAERRQEACTLHGRCMTRYPKWTIQIRRYEILNDYSWHWASFVYALHTCICQLLTLEQQICIFQIWCIMHTSSQGQWWLLWDSMWHQSTCYKSTCMKEYRSKLVGKHPSGLYTRSGESLVCHVKKLLCIQWEHLSIFLQFCLFYRKILGT